MSAEVKAFDTESGRIVVSGPLDTLEDLSFKELHSSILTDFERGQDLSSFQKPPVDQINKQFKVTPTKAINDIFSGPQYINLMTHLTPETVRLNRYSDILVCKTHADARNAVSLPEFINASYISSVTGRPQQFIATQGPLPHTLHDFWRMVWQSSCNSVFMLCSPNECQIGKCEVYWPRSGIEGRVGNFLLLILSETPRMGHIVRRIQVQLDGEVREITHYHYIAWPDHGVPKERASLNELLEDLLIEESKGPSVVVHCSAGVGRTGTLIALSYIKQIIAQQRRRGLDLGVSVFSVVRRLREQRVLMVQSKEQYEILFEFASDWTKS